MSWLRSPLVTQRRLPRSRIFRRAAHYNYFRNYDGSTGRYLESDPIGIFGGLSTYSYVYSNPGRLIDPRGLTPDCKPISYGPPIDAGFSRKNENRERYFTGRFEVDISNTDGPLGKPGPSPGKTPGSTKICASVVVMTSIYRIYLMVEEFDLYAKFRQKVLFKCTDPDGCEDRAYFHELTQTSELFVKHVRSEYLDRDLWKRFNAPLPSPVCLPGVGPFGPEH